MTQIQTCPHCNAVNKVAGLYTPGYWSRNEENTVSCGSCGKPFGAVDNSVVHEYKQSNKENSNAQGS